jgi:hypothetical protein
MCVASHWLITDSPFQTAILIGFKILNMTNGSNETCIMLDVRKETCKISDVMVQRMIH